MATINMQTMRYINLLHKVSGVSTRNCFVYNNVIIFSVSDKNMSRAIGPSGKNIKYIQEKLGKKVRIVKESLGIEDATRFVGDVVSPVTFISLELKNDIFILTAGIRSKAALIGRNRRRLLELSKIVEDNFGKDLKIV
ncbi:MAG: KH domain-containing protein [Bacteroidetes bacterium]|nr:KH domain-containing protein [Bacteroidota bacterium]